MTLLDLINKAIETGKAFNTHAIPLKYKGEDVNIYFVRQGNNEDGYVINMIIK